MVNGKTGMEVHNQHSLQQTLITTLMQIDLKLSNIEKLLDEITERLLCEHKNGDKK